MRKPTLDDFKLVRPQRFRHNCDGDGTWGQMKVIPESRLVICRACGTSYDLTDWDNGRFTEGLMVLDPGEL